MVSKLFIAGLVGLAQAARYGNETTTSVPANVPSTAMSMMVSTVTVTEYVNRETCDCSPTGTAVVAARYVVYPK